MNNGSEPAMPTHDVFEDCGFDGNSGPHLTQTTNYGMTKREMMAMHAMVGLLSCGKQYDIRHKSRASQLVEDAVFYADALLDELEHTK